MRIGWISGFACVLSCGSVWADTAYTDYTAWAQALSVVEANAHATRGVLLTDGFNNNQINVSGLSVVSEIDFQGFRSPGTGHFANNAWVDFTPKYETTTWTYIASDKEMFGWGANFNMPNVESGLEVNGSLFMPYLPGPPPFQGYPPFDSFWGFTSPTPHSTVWGLLRPGRTAGRRFCAILHDDELAIGDRNTTNAHTRAVNRTPGINGFEWLACNHQADAPERNGLELVGLQISASHLKLT